jgi:hypothetical protein
MSKEVVGGGVKERLKPPPNRDTVCAAIVPITGWHWWLLILRRIEWAVSEPNDGEAPVIVGLSDAAMHMYAAAIDALPDPSDPAFPDRAGVILSGLRKLQDSLADAASRSRVTPSVIVALSGVRSRYDDLMATAANGPGATLGQRLYIARGRAKLSTKEAANGVGLRKDLIEAVEAEEPVLEDEASRIKDLIAALGG